MPETAATERDARHLLQGHRARRKARGQTSPNPLVGAVVVKDGRVIGEGFTPPPGEAHAERVALAACGEDAAGATHVRVARALLPTTAARRRAQTRSSRPASRAW